MGPVYIWDLCKFGSGVNMEIVNLGQCLSTITLIIIASNQRDWVAIGFSNRGLWPGADLCLLWRLVVRVIDIIIKINIDCCHTLRSASSLCSCSLLPYLKRLEEHRHIGACHCEQEWIASGEVSLLLLPIWFNIMIVILDLILTLIQSFIVMIFMSTSQSMHNKYRDIDKGSRQQK